MEVVDVVDVLVLVVELELVVVLGASVVEVVLDELVVEELEVVVDDGWSRSSGGAGKSSASRPSTAVAM